MTLIKGGIPLLAAIVLIDEYGEDLYWFTEKIVGELERIRILKDLERFNLLATVQALGASKKGRIQYHKWHRQKLSRLDELGDIEMDSGLTVFEKLQQKNKPRTIFDGLIKYGGKRGV